MFYALRDEIAFEYKMAQEQDGEPAGVRTWLHCAIAQIQYVIRTQRCERKGHKWTSSYALEESGGEVLTCARCGNTKTHFF